MCRFVAKNQGSGDRGEPTADSQQPTAERKSPSFPLLTPGAHPVRVRNNVRFVPYRAAPRSESGRQRGIFPAFRLYLPRYRLYYISTPVGVVSVRTPFVTVSPLVRVL